MSGIAVGLKKGHLVTKREKRVRPAQRKGKLGERTKIIRSIIREVAGRAPYEKRLMEILKGGGNNPQKRAWRFAKKRLGTHKRAKRKVNEMQDAIGQQAKDQATLAVKKAAVSDDKKAKKAKAARAGRPKASNKKKDESKKDKSKSEKAEKSDKSAPPKDEKKEKPAKTEKTAKTEKSAKPEKPKESAESEKPSKSSEKKEPAKKEKAPKPAGK